MNARQSVAIIGAGISGLSCAHFLKDKYIVTVFERAENPGGLIKCRRVNGCLFHTCGGHIFNSKRKDVLDWFWSKFQREEQFTKADRNSVVFTEEGIEVPYPIENHVYYFPIEFQKAFINDLLSLAKDEEYEPSNFEEFLKHRFGGTLYRSYFQPYNEKVWRRDLSTVPLTWLEGKLPMPTIQDMIYNNMNHVEEKSFVHASFWYEKMNGSQFIADKLAEGLDIAYCTDIKTMKSIGDGWVIEGKKYDKVVFCGNIKDLVTMIEGVNIDKYTAKIDSLDYHGTTAVFCEIDRNPFSWIYQPCRAHESHRIICTGNFSPSNNSLSISQNRITGTVEFTDELTMDEIFENLKKIPLNPKYLDHQYNKYTYPIQDDKTREMIKNLKKELSSKDFFFTGRFADWEYYNMDVAIGAAMDLCNLL